MQMTTFEALKHSLDARAHSNTHTLTLVHSHGETRLLILECAESLNFFSVKTQSTGSVDPSGVFLYASGSETIEKTIENGTKINFYRKCSDRTA